MNKPPFAQFLPSCFKDEDCIICVLGYFKLRTAFSIRYVHAFGVILLLVQTMVYTTVLHLMSVIFNIEECASEVFQMETDLCLPVMRMCCG